MNEFTGVLVDIKPLDGETCAVVFECDQLLVKDANIELKVPLVFVAQLLELDKEDVEKYYKKVPGKIELKETKEFVNNDPYQKLIGLVKKEMKIF